MPIKNRPIMTKPQRREQNSKLKRMDLRLKISVLGSRLSVAQFHLRLAQTALQEANARVDAQSDGRRAAQREAAELAGPVRVLEESLRVANNAAFAQPRRAGLYTPAASPDTQIADLETKLTRAIRALERHGFQDHGGVEWKPPVVDVGPVMRALDLADQVDLLRDALQQSNQDLHDYRVVAHAQDQGRQTLQLQLGWEMKAYQANMVEAMKEAALGMLVAGEHSGPLTAMLRRMAFVNLRVEQNMQTHDAAAQRLQQQALEFPPSLVVESEGGEVD